MRNAVALFALAMVSGCTPIQLAQSTPSPSPSASPSTQATPSPSGVLAVVSGNRGNSISLVDENGKTVASAITAVASFLPNQVMPATSASRARVYYLNGGVDVRFLAPDGSSGHVTNLKLNPANEQAGFSVSPDDQRIAVSVFTFSGTTYAGMRLYVEDLAGANHLDIFSSTTLAEFPIGWVGHELVLAVSKPNCCQSYSPNPYGATEYHVINATTADRLVTLCGGDYAPEGPVEPFGVMCAFGGANFKSWDGSILPTPAAIPLPGPMLNAASPSGQRVAVGQANISIWGPNGASTNLNVSGTVYGWLDNDHLVIQKTGASQLSIVTVSTQASVDTKDATAYLGTLPAALS